MRQYATCREWLESYREMMTEIRRLKEKHKRLAEQATNVVAKLSLSPRGGGGDREQVLAALADIGDETDRRRVEAERQALEIEEFIDSIDDPASRIVLRARYLTTSRWTDARREMARAGLHYSNEHLYRLHRQALQKAEEKWIIMQNLCTK